jgi:hypothetical protein
MTWIEVGHDGITVPQDGIMMIRRGIRASFYEHNAKLRLGTEAVGEHTASSAATGDDDIVLLLHTDLTGVERKALVNDRV